LRIYCAAASKFVGQGAFKCIAFEFGVGQLASKRRLVPAKEAAMELRTRLNVLAAIISFAFLTAVVFGMF
jgi:hypothetical protein